MALETGTATSIFVRNPCIVTNTYWKYEVLLANFEHFIEKYFDLFAVPFMTSYFDNVSNIPISVVEKDTMIGTPDLIKQKASDQVLEMWVMATDSNRSKILPSEFRRIVEEGGEFATIATDVSAREVWLDENSNHVGSWRRVLNFGFSRKSQEMSEREMRKELNDYCDMVYGTKARGASRAVDATIGLTRAKFDVRTSLHRKLGSYEKPSVVVFAGVETAGITMKTHPLSDPELRNKFFSQHVEQCVAKGMSVKEAYQVFDGRAGLARMEDYINFCRKNGVEVNTYLPDIGVGNELDAIKMIAEGGSFKLFASVLLYANTHPYPEVENGYAVIREPEDASIIMV